MRLAILSSLFLAACGAQTTMVASHPAVARYTTNIDDTKSAVHDVLAERWMNIAPMGSDGFATPRECRTENGDACKRHTAFDHGTSTDEQTFLFQLAARVVPTGEGTIVSVVATLAPSKPGGESKTYEIGKGDVPSWMQGEVEKVQREISHKLAPVRPNG